MDAKNLLNHEFLKNNNNSQFIEYLYKLYEKNLKNHSISNASTINKEILSICQSNSKYYEQDNNLIKTIFINTFNSQINYNKNKNEQILEKSLKNSIKNTIKEFNNNLERYSNNINYNNSINIISNNYINNVNNINLIIPKIINSWKNKNNIK